MENYKVVDADQLDADLGTVGDAIREKGKTTEMLSFPDGMVSAIEAISTGVELNFDVVAYATEAALLAATPTKYTVGIISEYEMTGWVFSATEPSDPVEGMVWITVGTKSAVEFNALKKNAIQVYPLYAKQYVGGALVAVTAMSYRGGEWVNWLTYLFNKGNQYESITGGWTTKNTSGSTTEFGEVISSDCTYANATRWTHVVTKNKIDVSDYSKLYFDVEVTNRYSGFSDVIFGIVANQGSDSLVAKFISEGNKLPDLIEVVAVDISAISGEYYVQGSTSNAHLVIKSVWLER